MKGSPEIQELNRISTEAKYIKFPNTPRYAIPESKFTDKDTNGLTNCIIEYFRVKFGAFCTRLSSTGVYREDIKKYVANQQLSGMPDVFALYKGTVIFVEVKHSKDKLSAVQEKRIEQLRGAGALVFVAKDFKSFFHFINNELN